MNGSTSRMTAPGQEAEAWIRGVLRSPAGRPARLVVKVGGSLLSRPGWPGLLASLLDGLDRRPCRIVVGGGAIVDGLRTIDRAHPQPAPLAHGLAIDALRLTARLVCEAVGLPLTATWDPAIGLAVLDVPAWLAGSDAAARLPAGWQVTSDSLAACAAEGGGLWLAKSVPPPPCPIGADPIKAAATAGWVDEHFPAAAAGLGEIGWAAPASLSGGG